jgi:hypothetical protein
LGKGRWEARRSTVVHKLTRCMKLASEGDRRLSEGSANVKCDTAAARIVKTRWRLAVCGKAVATSDVKPRRLISSRPVLANAFSRLRVRIARLPPLMYAIATIIPPSALVAAPFASWKQIAADAVAGPLHVCDPASSC